MGFTQARIWRFGIFQGLKNLLSSEKKLVKCFMVSESGVGSIVSLKLATGYCVAETEKLAWCVLQKLKLPMQGVEEPVLPISERSYMPLDPLGLLSEEEKKNLEPLKNVSKARHAEERSRIADENRKNANTRLLTTIIWLCFIMTMILVIVFLFKR